MPAADGVVGAAQAGQGWPQVHNTPNLNESKKKKKKNQGVTYCCRRRDR